MAAAGARGEVRETPDAAEAEGAGGTISGASARLELRLDEPTLGGGGTTFVASSREDVPAPEVTLGGGGTTSCVPKIFPMMLLMNEGAAVWVGGGGTTFGDAAAPLSRRRRSWVESAEGGGATMDGAGRLSFAFLSSSRSGALTGGGTMATFVILTLVDGASIPLVSGAGATTRAVSAGVERDSAAETWVGAGAITFVLNSGPASVC